MRQAVSDRMLEVAELGSGHVVVSASGALDGNAAHELTEMLLPLVAVRRCHVVVDLTNAHAVERITIGVMAAAAHVARREGGALVVVTPDQRISGIVGQLGLGDLVRVERTLRDATGDPWGELS